MFAVGESVVYPGYGSGKVIEITTLSTLGAPKPYYLVRLVGGTGTQVWIPVNRAEEKGVRRPLRQSRLVDVWRRLRNNPEELPQDHKLRYAVIRDRLQNGGAMLVAEAVRDLWHKDSHVRRLTIEGKRLYEQALNLLSAEVAVMEGTDLESAEEQITEQLRESDVGSGL